MKHIGNIAFAPGSVKKSKRIGRGTGSGHGGTSTRGHKGAGARSGTKNKAAFEGGQMPISRRLPKFGFTNIHRVEFQVINIARIQELIELGRLSATSVIDREALFNAGGISKRSMLLKVLGNGTISSSVNIQVDGITQSAKTKIEQAGGSVIINE
jgi:large subunit ribosomal protein L15